MRGLTRSRAKTSTVKPSGAVIRPASSASSETRIGEGSSTEPSTVTSENCPTSPFGCPAAAIGTSAVARAAVMAGTEESCHGGSVALGLDLPTQWLARDIAPNRPAYFVHLVAPIRRRARTSARLMSSRTDPDIRRDQ